MCICIKRSGVERAALGVVCILCACIMWLPLLAEVHIRLVLGCLYLVLPPSLEMQVFILVSAECAGVLFVSHMCGDISWRWFDVGWVNLCIML